MNQENARFLMDFLRELAGEVEDEEDLAKKLKECADEVEFDWRQRRYRMDSTQGRLSNPELWQKPNVS